MTELPLVSVVTPSLEQGEFIADAIRSVADQTYPHVEHVVVDGGSRDATLDVLRTRAEAQPALRWLSEPDDGQADAIRKGFALARGEILSWLTADDVYLHDGVLERVVELFRGHPEAGLVAGTAIFLSEDGKPREAIPVPREITFEALRYKHLVVQPATFMRRAVVEATPLDCSLHYAFDWDFFVRASRRYPVFVVDEPFAGYRMYGRNKSAASGSRRTAELAEVTGRYLGRASAQYRILALATRADRLVDRVPAPARPWARYGLYHGPMAVAYRLCGGRLQT